MLPRALLAREPTPPRQRQQRQTAVGSSWSYLQGDKMLRVLRRKHRPLVHSARSAD
jgi:hypothetical protein